MEMYSEHAFCISILGKWCGKIDQYGSLQPLLYRYAIIILPTHRDRPKYLIDKIPERKNIHIEENISERNESNYTAVYEYIIYIYFFQITNF